MTKRIITPEHPEFYINRKRYIEIETDVRTAVAGFFGGRALKNGRVTREFGFATDNPNLLTDIGLNGLSGAASSPPGFLYMQLGTGTTPPATTNGQLQSYGLSIGGAVLDGSGNGGAPNYYGWRRWSWTSAIGGATGNWTEIGISSSNANTPGALRSRALILDNSANPTVFPVLADEQFQGYYEFRVYPSLVDDTRVVNVGSTPHDVVTRAATVGNWVAPNIATSSSFEWFGVSLAHNGVLGAVTANPSNPLVNGQYPNLVGAAYGSGNLYRDYSLSLSPTQWAMTFRGWSQNASGGLIHHQHRFDPAIVKTNTESMIFNVRHSWARR